MERMDKLLASTGRWSRKEVKELIRQGRVMADGRPVGRPEERYEPGGVHITVDGEAVDASLFVYVMLHKPAGLLSATEDSRQPTVLDLLPPELKRRGLFPGPAGQGYHRTAPPHRRRGTGPPASFTQKACG